MKSLLLVAVVACSTGLFCADAFAQGGRAAPAPVQNPNNPYDSRVAGTISWRLGARFQMQWVNSAGQRYVAARLTENPMRGSPLQQLGLQVGDVIVRMDGERITCFDALNNHIQDTSVRFVRMSSNPNDFEMGQIFIDPSDRFGGIGWSSGRQPIHGQGGNGP